MGLVGNDAGRTFFFSAEMNSADLLQRECVSVGHHTYVSSGWWIN